MLGYIPGVTVLPVVNQPATLKTGLRVPARVMLRTVTPIPKKPAMRGMTSGSLELGEPSNFGENWIFVVGKNIGSAQFVRSIR